MKTNFNTLIKTVKEMSIFEIIFFGFVTLFLFLLEQYYHWELFQF